MNTGSCRALLLPANPVKTSGMVGVHGADRGDPVQEGNQQRLGSEGLESVHGRGR